MSMKFKAENILNRSKSFYDDTANTMRLSNIKSKLKNVSNSLTSVNPFNKKTVNDVEESPNNLLDEKKAAHRRKKGKKHTNSTEGERKHRSKCKQKEVEIGGARSTFANSAPVSPTVDYVVSVDDTLSSVAARFGLTPSELCHNNRLVCRSLFAGQVLKVPKANTDEAQHESNKGETETEHVNREKLLGDECLTEREIPESPKDDDQQNIGSVKYAPTSEECTSQESEEYSSSVETDDASTEEDEDPLAAKYLKLQAEFVDDLQTLINGQLLITTNTFLFTPFEDCAAEPNRYHLLLPLARIRSVAVYKDHSVLYFTKRDAHLPTRSSSCRRRARSKPRPPESFARSHSEISKHHRASTESNKEENSSDRVSDIQASDLTGPNKSPQSSRDKISEFESPDPSTSTCSVPSGDEKPAKTNTTVPNIPHSSPQVVISADSDSMEYLCILASKPNTARRRHPIWFTIQSEEYWFRIPVEKGPILFQFLQACEFDKEAVEVSAMDSTALHGSKTSPGNLFEEADSPGVQGFVVVPSTYDWLLPRIGSIDERSKALFLRRENRRRRVQSCKLSVEQSKAQNANEPSTSAWSLDGGSTLENDGSLPSRKMATQSTPSLQEEKDALRRLKQESVRWEWIRTSFLHAWDNFSHWLVNTNEIKLQEAEERRRQFILDSLNLSKPENLPLPPATSSSQVLDCGKVRDLMRNLPPEAEGLDWSLTYSTSLHGFSLRTLYYRCSLHSSEEVVQTSWTSTHSTPDQVSSFSSIHPCILVLKTSQGETFGAMLNTHPYASGGRFYGTGSCYVFRWLRKTDQKVQDTVKAGSHDGTSTSLPDVHEEEATEEHISEEDTAKFVHVGHEVENVSSAESDVSTEQGVDVTEDFRRFSCFDDTDLESAKASREIDTFEKFIWSGKNNFFINGENDSLTIGCAQGHSAIHLDDVLLHGRTEACETFDSPPLCSNKDFIVQNLEIWSFI